MAVFFVYSSNLRTHLSQRRFTPSIDNDGDILTVDPEIFVLVASPEQIKHIYPFYPGDNAEERVNCRDRYHSIKQFGMWAKDWIKPISL